ncbi:mucin TcMUCII [Trypanosoma cruzi]|nr:mucin TcMUCII [Trypanosoma cruzi]
MEQALPPPPHHRRHVLLIPDGTRETVPHPLRECPVVGNWDCDCVGLPSPHDGSFATEYLPLLYGRPLRYSPVIVAAYNQNNITSCFVMNIGCRSRGPTIHVVCGDLFLLIVTLLLCCCVRCTFLCACAPSVRGADTTDRSRRMYMRWSLVCRSCLLLPLPSVCWCCGRAVCVCVPAAVEWSVCRAWCAAYAACLAAALSSCGVLSVCVCRTSRLPCCSPCPSLCRSAPHH